jgi:hypothetical protein
MDWMITEHRDGNYYVGLVSDDGTVIRQHPIEFLNIREAHRAVDRLNKRDFGDDHPVRVLPWAELRR